MFYEWRVRELCENQGEVEAEACPRERAVREITGRGYSADELRSISV